MIELSVGDTVMLHSGGNHAMTINSISEDKRLVEIVWMTPEAELRRDTVMYWSLTKVEWDSDKRWVYPKEAA